MTNSRVALTDKRFDSPHTLSDLPDLFPLPSETSKNDKLFLLGSLGLVRQKGSYAYIEIGSFLGGSLTPFLLDPACNMVFSIDDRGKVLPDERGINFDYSDFSTQSMLDKLGQFDVPTEKLKTLDGSVNEVGKNYASSFEVAFIDGEHTNEASFRDFIWTLPLMKEDSMVMFHDSSLIFRSLKLILLYLDKIQVPHTFFKKRDSEMSALFFGKFRQIDYAKYFGQEESAAVFFATSEAAQIKYQFKNRAHIRFAPLKLFKLKIPFALDIKEPRTEKTI